MFRHMTYPRSNAYRRARKRRSPMRTLAYAGHRNQAVTARAPTSPRLQSAEDDRDLYLPPPLEDFDRHLISVTAHLEVDARLLELQIAQHQLVYKRRQARIAQADFVREWIELQAERGLDQREGSGARPRLRQAGDRIVGRSAPAAALKTAEQLGQAPHLHVGRGVEQALEDALDRTPEPVAGQAERNQRIVMRPDRAVVIGHRIVARFGIGDGANAPSGEELRPQQAVGYLDRPIGLGNAGEQDLTGIRAADAAGLLLAVERERVGLELLAPEACVESLRQLMGFSLEATRALVPPQPFGATCQHLLRAIDVALHLRKRDRPLRQAAVGVENRILGIFPALVGETALGRAVVFEKAVAIGISGAVDPGERGLDRGPQLHDDSVVAGALGIDAGEHDEERRRVDAAVVEAEGDLAQRRHLAFAHLMQNLSRLRVRRRVVGRGLIGGEPPQRAMRGSNQSICSAVINPSRPNVVEYQGMPA